MSEECRHERIVPKERKRRHTITCHVYFFFSTITEKTTTNTGTVDLITLFSVRSISTCRGKRRGVCAVRGRAPQRRP